jgi:hypothetical protein
VCMRREEIFVNLWCVFWCWTAGLHGEGNMCVGYGISVVMFCVCV